MLQQFFTSRLLLSIYQYAGLEKSLRIKAYPLDKKLSNSACPGQVLVGSFNALGSRRLVMSDLLPNSTSGKEKLVVPGKINGWYFF